eukprot:4022608-Prymnesium_polylepis.1
MAIAWQSHGNHVAITRQSHGNHAAITSRGNHAAITCRAYSRLASRSLRRASISASALSSCEGEGER